MVYTEEFGKRFSLPSGGIQPLDPGLQAVVIRVVERAGDHPGCFLDLYLDDSLDLAFPEGSEGVISYPDDMNPFFFIRGNAPLGVEEHRWDAMLGSFHTRGCRNGSKGCVEEVGSPYAYFRHLVPGVALQTYMLMCDLFDPVHGATELWLLRSGQDRAALDAQSTDDAATYRFAMPAALFAHAAPRIRQAVKYYADIGRQGDGAAQHLGGHRVEGQRVAPGRADERPFFGASLASAGSAAGKAGTGAAGDASDGGTTRGTMRKKFVGNITTNGAVRDGFAMYWDQITPENEGKWGSVQPSQGMFNWSALDKIYAPGRPSMRSALRPTTLRRYRPRR